MTFVKWVDKFNKLLSVLVGLIFGVMVISIFFQILVRFVFSEFNLQISAPWTEELARYLMIWSVFLGGSLAARSDRMISLEFLTHALPARLGKALKTGALIVTIVFFIYIFFIGYDLASNQGVNQTSPVLGVSMASVYLAMPFGAAITILNIITLLIETRLTKQDIRHVSMKSDQEAIEEEIGTKIN